jgi:UDP-N-acetylmuramoyl-L-alanyl-D-glutamate--2,6-diaminopimelate ligase
VLADVIDETPKLAVTGDLSVEITDISTDSRSIAPGAVFVACPGQNTDGRQFIDQAVAAGAAAVVCEPPAPSAVTVPLILVPDARRAVADLACALHGHPSRQIGLVGVTGTDGKTTTAHLIAAILNADGVRAGLISTVAVNLGAKDEKNRTAHTTPQAPIIQRSLAQMRDAGVKVAVLEVSSHALVTERVHGCVFDCAVFTNLDPEHLDFHGTLLNYRAAKARLFAQLDRGPAKPWGRLAVVNHDDPSSVAMRSACSVPCVEYGLSDRAGVRAEILHASLDGTTFRVHTPDGDETIQTRLPGPHNVRNWLGAIAAARHFGATLADARRAAEEFSGVPGRLEALRHGQPFHVFVDFAHTPQALAATTDVLKRYTNGRLIVLFGQAGRRDLRNRSRMAFAVAERADLAILTSDDPYDEDPQVIVDDLATSLRKAGWRENRRFWKIVDRRSAIEFAMALARPGDCVLLAGRGPEEETVIGGQKIPLVDAEVARDALTRRRIA